MEVQELIHLLIEEDLMVRVAFCANFQTKTVIGKQLKLLLGMK